MLDNVIFVRSLGVRNAQLLWVYMKETCREVVNEGTRSIKEVGTCRL